MEKKRLLLTDTPYNMSSGTHNFLSKMSSAGVHPVLLFTEEL